MTTDTFELVEVENIPFPFDQGKLYHEPRSGRVAFKCPCDCGANIVLPTVAPKQPRWSMTVNLGRVTLNPSIRTKPCNAHYFIRDNSVEWCSDTGRET